MTHGKTRSFKALTLLIALFTMTIGITPYSMAEIVSSDTIISELDTQSDAMVIQDALADEAVQNKLQQLGFSVDEVQQRLARMDAQQRHDLANQIQSAQTGAGTGAFVALIVIIAIVGIVWFLVNEIDPQNHTHP